MDEQLYVGQLAELLFALDIRAPIDLIGVSQGGAIVASFAAKYPQKVRCLGLVCPAGLPFPTPFVMSRLVRMPLIGPLLFKLSLPGMQARGAAAQWEGDKDGEEYRAWGAFARANAATHPGFVRSLYRTVLQYPLSDMNHNWRVLAAQKHLHTLIVWGDADGLCPYSNAAVLSALLPSSQLVTIRDAKHNMLIQRGRVIAEVLARWLEEPEARLPTHVRNECKQEE